MLDGVILYHSCSVSEQYRISAATPLGSAILNRSILSELILDHISIV